MQDLMSFRGVPFPDGTPLFPDQGKSLGPFVHPSRSTLATTQTNHHLNSATVLRYLQDYARNNDLLPHIRFNTPVKRVYLTPSPAPSNRRWTIEYADIGHGGGEEEFDYISVANGHYTDSWIPQIEGLRCVGLSQLRSSANQM